MSLSGVAAGILAQTSAACVNRDTGGLRRTDRNGIRWCLSREAGLSPCSGGWDQGRWWFHKTCPSPHPGRWGGPSGATPGWGGREQICLPHCQVITHQPSASFPSPLPSPHNVTTKVRRDDTEPPGTFQRRKPDGEKSGAHHLLESRSCC